jgi:hypothetical protein
MASSMRDQAKTSGPLDLPDRARAPRQPVRSRIPLTARRVASFGTRHAGQVGLGPDVVRGQEQVRDLRGDGGPLRPQVHGVDQQHPTSATTIGIGRRRKDCTPVIHSASMPLSAAKSGSTARSGAPSSQDVQVGGDGPLLPAGPDGDPARGAVRDLERLDAGVGGTNASPGSGGGASTGRISFSMVGLSRSRLAASYMPKRMSAMRMRVPWRPMVRVLASFESAATSFRVRTDQLLERGLDAGRVLAGEPPASPMARLSFSPLRLFPWGCGPWCR